MAAVRLPIVRRVRNAFAARSPLMGDDLWPLVQTTAAATVAWVIARRLVDHHEPFFAPIAALVSLNTPLGERGLQALRLLQGVVLGIGVGELVLIAFGGGYASLALGMFVALLLARWLGGARVTLAQAAVGAILTISTGNADIGPQRLIDALIGAGVALVFSQLLFSPEPLRLLRRVETNALKAMAAGLDLTAQALRGDKALGERAIGSQRELRDHLSELARIRRASARVARHSLVWRGQRAPLVRENEDAGHLDLLGGSCLLLARTSLGASDEDQSVLAPCVAAFSATLADLARQPGDQAARQRAVDRSLEVLRTMRSRHTDRDGELTTVLSAARIAVTDLMLFVGVDADEASAATREEAPDDPEPEVPEVASDRKPPVRRLRRWFRALAEKLRTFRSPRPG